MKKYLILFFLFFILVIYAKDKKFDINIGGGLNIFPGIGISVVTSTHHFKIQQPSLGYFFSVSVFTNIFFAYFINTYFSFGFDCKIGYLLNLFSGWAPESNDIIVNLNMVNRIGKKDKKIKFLISYGAQFLIRIIFGTRWINNEPTSYWGTWLGPNIFSGLEVQYKKFVFITGGNVESNFLLEYNAYNHIIYDIKVGLEFRFLINIKKNNAV